MWFKDTEYRAKPETIKYRVALFDFSYGKTPAIAQTRWQADSWEDMASFVRWLTDWVEVEF